LNICATVWLFYGCFLRPGGLDDELIHNDVKLEPDLYRVADPTRERNMKWVMSLGMCLVFLFSCSEKDTTIITDKKYQQQLSERREKRIKWKIEVLSLKYSISSEDFKKGLLVEFTKGPIERFFDIEEITKFFEVETYMPDINKIKSVSEKYSIPLETMGSILYDFKIWESIDSLGGRAAGDKK
jgi:hypothetical protein